ncbi:hypothetical protein AMAG_11916 [Allomyces macrogynus ATCC 38327]|uniref:U2A'/phosphoprotein 32 family A C-terminal domain-containing protein n=1 Tax=Allomyces macrogynus (strain ATCC 38327) TaxID=578462 RepID=A0A0L0SY64_ALLM3|nr:hypothetical protein AMAG_11916 [Allomyces macrogynus ATCC 38327]|eukprot:KNE67453.1 hypothetical protein AMAG_11916 [Allomyces macrogynus ATCC 38327]
MADLEIISSSVSQIDRTPDGLHYAFIRLDAPGKGLGSAEPLSGFPHLRYIDVSGNSLMTLARGLAPQKYLLSLTAARNKLAKVEDAVFASKEFLLYLDLSGNEIVECETTRWPKLATLNLNKNQLSVLRIADAQGLLTLEARSNLMLDVAVDNAPKLQKVYLAGNQISSIAFLKDKAQLELIHLRDNTIASLADLHDSSLAKVTYLNLRNNKIADFDEIDHLRSLKSLTKLVLRENPIAELDNYRHNIIYRLPSLQVLDKEAITVDEREESEQVRVSNERAREEMQAQRRAMATAEAAAAREAAADEDGDEEEDGGEQD